MAEKIIRSDAILFGHSKSQTHDIQALIFRGEGIAFERTDKNTIHTVDDNGNYIYPALVTIGEEPLKASHLAANGEHVQELMTDLGENIGIESSLIGLQESNRNIVRTPIAGVLSRKGALVLGRFISMPRSRDGKYITRSLDGGALSRPGLSHMYEAQKPLVSIPFEGTTPGEIAKYLWEQIIPDEEDAALAVKTVERRTGQVLVSTIDTQYKEARPL